MNTLTFSKYQGTGNDFILVDNRLSTFPKNNLNLITLLCDRKFGIGSDGIILIEDHPEYDFEMVFFNPDGSQSFCGNGSRCAVSFARSLGIIKDQARFVAIDGNHHSEIFEHNVRVKMADAGLPNEILNGKFLHTGSPHYIEFVSDIANFDVFGTGKEIRNKTELFGAGGTNVNFVEELDKGRIFVRTFERGVENETLSCGTGVTAAGIVYGDLKGLSSVGIQSPGGNLQVDFEKNGDTGFQNIYLSGPASKVFEGSITLPDELM